MFSRKTRKSWHTFNELLLQHPLIFPWGAQEAAMRPWSTEAAGKAPACPSIPHHPKHHLRWNLQEPFPLNFWEEGKGWASTWSILCSIFPSAILSLQSNWNSLPTPMMDNSATSVTSLGTLQLLQAPWNSFSQRSWVKFEMRKQES